MSNILPVSGMAPGASRLSALSDISQTGATTGGVPIATAVSNPGTPQAAVTAWAVKTQMNPIVAALVFGS